MWIAIFVRSVQSLCKQTEKAFLLRRTEVSCVFLSATKWFSRNVAEHPVQMLRTANSFLNPCGVAFRARRILNCFAFDLHLRSVLRGRSRSPFFDANPISPVAVRALTFEAIFVRDLCRQRSSVGWVCLSARTDKPQQKAVHFHSARCLRWTSFGSARHAAQNLRLSLSQRPFYRCCSRYKPAEDAIAYDAVDIS